MKNYQKLYYQHYYEMLPNGEESEVTRRECFSPAEDPTPANPFKQRWFYDPEASYAVRMPRNQMGDVLGKRNAADLKAAERYQIRKNENCPGELDKPISFGVDGNEAFIEVADETADILAILEDQERLSALFSALNRLTIHHSKEKSPAGERGSLFLQGLDLYG